MRRCCLFLLIFGTAMQASAQSAVRLMLESVTIEEGTTLKTLLRERSVLADGNALATVYYLNPALRSVDEIKAGESLVLPRAVPTTEPWRASSSSGNGARF